MTYELWVSWRYLWSQRRERFITLLSWISVAGVAIGVAALIVVIGVMEGFGQELRDKIIGVNPHLVLEQVDGLSDPEAVLERLRDDPEVVGASPFVTGQAIVRYEETATGVAVRAIDPEQERHVTNLHELLLEGGQPLAVDRVWLGRVLAERLGVAPGDAIELVSAARTTPASFEVVGLFQSGMYEFDASVAILSLEGAEALLGLGGTVSGIGIRLQDPERAPGVRQRLAQEFGFPYWLQTWQDMNRNLFAALKLEKLAMFVILALIVLVACANIASTLLMLVLEKTRDIGILKAIGATRVAVAKIFSYYGLLVGVIGTTIGAALGGALAWALDRYQFIKLPSDIYYIDRLPVLVDVQDIALIVVCAIALSSLATIYPAWHGARLDPVEALRYE